MSDYSNTPWNPDTDNTIAADVVDAGPRSVTFSRLAYSDDPAMPDVVEDDAIAADTIDDGRWARRRVALALGGAASVIVASAAVALAAINSVDTSTSVTAAGGSTAMPAAAPVVRVEPPSGLPAPSTAQITVEPVAPNVPDYVPVAAPQRPAAPLVTAAPPAAPAPEMAPPAPAPEKVPAPPAQPLPSFPPIIINLPVPPAAPPKPPAPAPKPDGPVVKGPLAIPSPEKTPPVNPNLSLDAG
ncbi:hypothetical protein [Mycolicibacterium llatzerense]|uniref:hypothetical protein n=1 Tax=Mycolicibacterium llatzerense TaxID=280871 RepID=UPI0021B4E196|nr:hypothetical protein [Mycolicibacterium llatzerense]MCT7363668.1 hypothetical protein [Mycolicibacterium llatzerense]MCT7367824.1 hypothetical protein [Mycolicibacterium llatzerense]